MLYQYLTLNGRYIRSSQWRVETTWLRGLPVNAFSKLGDLNTAGPDDLGENKPHRNYVLQWNLSVNRGLRVTWLRQLVTSVHTWRHPGFPRRRCQSVFAHTD
jgi:hypothetical protein